MSQPISPDSLLVAKQISDYLTLGMHHTTSEAQEKIAGMVDQLIKERDCARFEKALRDWRVGR